jgi:two-component system, OmpR family, response regulator VicR
LSALKQGANVERALTLGAQDFIAKPFNPKELVLRIKRFLPE